MIFTGATQTGNWHWQTGGVRFSDGRQPTDAPVFERRAHQIETLSADDELGMELLRRFLPPAVAAWHIRLKLFPAIRYARFTPIEGGS